ncbi:hypothetical protein ANANG_G00048820 [Anguilla anguilla]|uniref:Uncharacterized protein n=1 Tax=Anguilla anguilla TaxID=7936 RepID=A0A9D3MY29_ANGAN|nr:hypothetical protein ANANG_G00048820 [Anguilla anguilla]
MVALLKLVLEMFYYNFPAGRLLETQMQDINRPKELNDTFVPRCHGNLRHGVRLRTSRQNAEDSRDVSSA